MSSAPASLCWPQLTGRLFKVLNFLRYFPLSCTSVINDPFKINSNLMLDVIANQHQFNAHYFNTDHVDKTLEAITFGGSCLLLLLVLGVCMFSR
jgi:hypothetical protein